LTKIGSFPLWLHALVVNLYQLNFVKVYWLGSPQITGGFCKIVFYGYIFFVQKAKIKIDKNPPFDYN